MSRRTTLIVVSIAGHFAIGIGMFASGIWELERLESDHRLGAIGVMSVTQVAGGSPADLPEPNFKKKEQKEKVIPKDQVQWEKRVEKPDQKAVENAKIGGTGNGKGEGEGDKIGDGKDDIDSVGCATPPCSPEAQPEVKLPEPPP